MVLKNSMKRCLIIFGLLVFGLSANADFVELGTDVNMNNFWEKSGKDTQKILDIHSKILNTNKLNKHVSIVLYSASKTINAEAHYMDKSIYVYTGILPYIDNDDELAFLISHEIAHCIDYYDGPLKLFTMELNSKDYELKADSIAIDMMVKAGYNPIAAICIMNKLSGESVWDTWIFYSHPKGSTRMMNMYKYIYKKYPDALNSDMVKNINYQNFTYSSQKELDEFKLKEKLRKNKRDESL